MTRRSLSNTARAKIFEAHNQCCHICGLPIFNRAWDVEHIIPLGMGGADDETNMAPAHRACHSPKTVADIRRIAKAKRQSAKHVGAFQSFRPMPGSKRSKFRKRMDGTVEIRK